MLNSINEIITIGVIESLLYILIILARRPLGLSFSLIFDGIASHYIATQRKRDGLATSGQIKTISGTAIAICFDLPLAGNAITTLLMIIDVVNLHPSKC